MPKFAVVTLALASAIYGFAAAAQTFPSNVIRIVVSFSVGTPADIVSRLVATGLGENEGWRMIVEDRPGAIGTVAGSEVLRQPADGYSLYALTAPVTAAPALLKDMPYDLLRDFTPVVRISTSYNVLVVNPSVPAKSLAEFVALLKSRPDELTFSSAGFGSPAHLIGELFMLQAGIRARHVPYQQFSQGTADLLNGTNQFEFVAIMPVVGLINSGKLRALAVTAPHRLAVLPDVPTVIEAGYPALVMENWVGFAVSRGTPDPIVQRLNKAVNNVLAKPNVRKAIADMGAEPIGGTASDFSRVIAAEVAHWSQVVRESGIAMQP